jgi:hypothetical protein
MVSVQLENAEHGTVNLSIFLDDDSSPVTMLEDVSGHVDEAKVEVRKRKRKRKTYFKMYL